MKLLPIHNLLLKLAAALETQYLSTDEYQEIFNTSNDDPTILSLYAKARTTAQKDVAAKFFTPLPNIRWSTYLDTTAKRFLSGRPANSPKYAFILGNTIYVNLNVKTLQQNLPSVPNSLKEICTHEAGHVLYNIVKSKLSRSIDDESFADIVTKFVAPRELFDGASAPKQFAMLQSILQDLRHTP
jgi:hypothetical protein